MQVSKRTRGGVCLSNVTYHPPASASADWCAPTTAFASRPFNDIASPHWECELFTRL